MPRKHIMIVIVAKRGGEISKYRCSDNGTRATESRIVP